MIVYYMVPREWYVWARLGADRIDTSNQRVPMVADEVLSARSALVEYVPVLFQHGQWVSEMARPVVILVIDVGVSVGLRVNVFWDVWLSLGLVVQRNRRPTNAIITDRHNTTRLTVRARGRGAEIKTNSSSSPAETRQHSSWYEPSWDEGRLLEEVSSGEGVLPFASGMVGDDEAYFY